MPDRNLMTTWRLFWVQPEVVERVVFEGLSRRICIKNDWIQQSDLFSSTSRFHSAFKEADEDFVPV